MQQDAGLKQGQNGRDSEMSLCVSGALETGLGVPLWDVLSLPAREGWTSHCLLLSKKVYCGKKKEHGL